MNKALSLLLMLLMAATLAACGDDDDGCTKGTKGCACKPNNECDGNLVCENDKCVEPTACTPGEECCECASGNTCDVDLVCDVEDNKCVTADACCPCKDTIHITVAGVVSSFPAGEPGVTIKLSAVNPGELLTVGTATPKASTDSDAQGSFNFDCFNVDATEFVHGLTLLADDADGAANNFYPTVSGIAGWTETDMSDRVCIEEGADSAKAFVMSNQLLGGLNAFLEAAQLATLDPDTDGVIIGAVLDANRASMSGVMVKACTRTDSEGVCDQTDDFSIVYYPQFDESGLTGIGTDSTGLTGVYIIPGTQFKPSEMKNLVGFKEGFKWQGDTYKAAAIKGFAYFVPVIANETQ